jgi:hypothetical protein
LAYNPSEAELLVTVAVASGAIVARLGLVFVGLAVRLLVLQRRPA